MRVRSIDLQTQNRLIVKKVDRTFPDRRDGKYNKVEESR